MDNYKVSIYEINYLSQSFMLAYPFMNQPAVWAIDRISLKFGLSIGIVMTTIGLWLKFLINESFIYVMVGQTIVAMG
jgi:fucose permease